MVVVCKAVVVVGAAVVEVNFVVEAVVVCSVVMGTVLVRRGVVVGEVVRHINCSSVKEMID